MGIRVDFLIKHLRPADMDAWAAICKPRGQGSLNQWLLDSLAMSQQDIDAVFNDWAKLALLDINDPGNQAIFVKAAQEISQLRWASLYDTNYSSIMFFTEPLLKELSYVASSQTGDFDFDPSETIPLVVTINQLQQPPSVQRGVAGASLKADPQGNCYHFYGLINATYTMTAKQTPEQIRRASLSTSFAEQVFNRASEDATRKGVEAFFGIRPKAVATATALTSAAPSADSLNALLNNVGTAPGSSTTVTVPTAPASGDLTLVQNVQTLDSYIATLTALVMYNNHPAPYDLSDKTQAAQFVTDLANARNFVVTGGTVKAVPMYLPMGEATTQTLNKSTTSADLHLDLLTALFGALSLPASVLTELDGILTEIADSLKNLQLSYQSQTQTLNHFVSFYYLTPVEGTNPPINQMNVEFIYLQMAQSSWKASVGKSSVSHFTLDMTTTRTTATMSAGIVAANTSNIVSSLMQLTGNDATQIANMTKMKGVQT
jgi:hypothetical protein